MHFSIWNAQPLGTVEIKEKKRTWKEGDVVLSNKSIEQWAYSQQIVATGIHAGKNEVKEIYI